MVTIGVIADTHIPDRTRALDPRIIPFFRQKKVDVILHAGDVCTLAVLDELRRVAPVNAVRGNRDWLALRQLPLTISLNIEGVSIMMTHGHGRWWDYLLERTHHILFGFNQRRYLLRLLADFPNAKVIVFGHTHRPFNAWLQDKLLFNPGSPHHPGDKNAPHSVGLIHILPGQTIQGEIIHLEE